MDRNFEPSSVWLAPDAVLRLDRARGKAISVKSGHVWITQTGDRHDTMLGPGERFRFDRGGRALVQGLEFTELHLLDGADGYDWAEDESVPVEPAPARDRASMATPLNAGSTMRTRFS
jgi:hypothetical protein